MATEGEAADAASPLACSLGIGRAAFHMKRIRWVGATTGVVTLFALVTVGATQAPPDPAKVEAGETVYGTYCAPCHGEGLRSTGQFPDLRRLRPSDRTKFETTVRDGRNQMPPWRGVISDEQIDQIWAYIRDTADR